MTNENTFPARVTGEIWLGYNPSYQTPADLHIMGGDLSDLGYVMVGPIALTVDVPEDADPVAMQIASIERERDAVQTRSARRLAQLDDRLAQLQAITYQPEVSA